MNRLADWQSWMVQAAEALVYMHSKGVVHNGVQPEHMLLWKESNTVCSAHASLCA
jgi:hypothetical protein